jgi:hypothetical protein
MLPPSPLSQFQSGAFSNRYYLRQAKEEFFFAVVEQDDDFLELDTAP